jgi:hypothetical protein
MHSHRYAMEYRNFVTRGPGSVVGIATAYGLDGPGIESRWKRDFPHLSTSAENLALTGIRSPDRPARTQSLYRLRGPEAHPASCTMGTESFPGVMLGRGVTLTPHPLLVPRSKIEYSYTSTIPKGLCDL